MFEGYIVLISAPCGNCGAKSFGVVCKENGCPIFTKEEAEEEARPDPICPDVKYRIICISDLFDDSLDDPDHYV